MVRQGKSCIKVILLVLLLIFVCLCSVGALCSILAKQSIKGPYSLDDEALLPFAMMYQVDRKQFCLTEIPQHARVKIKETSKYEGYDVILYIRDDKVSRSVFFAWENEQYVWIGERENHYSGREFMTPDGKMQERIKISYFERKVDDTIKGAYISYIGRDGSIPSLPTCDQALTYIREWDAARTKPDNH